MLARLQLDCCVDVMQPRCVSESRVEVRKRSTTEWLPRSLGKIENSFNVMLCFITVMSEPSCSLTCRPVAENETTDELMSENEAIEVQFDPFQLS